MTGNKNLHNSSSEIGIRHARGLIFIETLVYNESVIERIRSLPGRRWDPEIRRWVIPYSEETSSKIQSLFFTKDETDLITKARKIMEFRKYSRDTIQSYLRWIRIYINKFGEFPVISQKELQGFMDGISENLSPSSVHQMMSALSFLYSQVLGVTFPQFVRPRKSKILPSILSLNEVIKILNYAKNPKHRALLSVTYSGGLRVSEVVRLRPGDIHVDRGMIRIQRGKGRKDRYTLLSKKAADDLVRYRLQETSD